MAFVGGTFAQRLYGGKPDTANGTLPDVRNLNAVNQVQAESLTADTYRMMRGPRQNGHLSAHIIVGAGSSPGAGSALTVWYSNLPDPDPTNAAHWVQDTSISSVDLTVAANTFLNVGNINAEYVMFKAHVVSGTVALVLFARAEGPSVRG